MIIIIIIITYTYPTATKQIHFHAIYDVTSRKADTRLEQVDVISLPFLYSS